MSSVPSSCAFNIFNTILSEVVSPIFCDISESIKSFGLVTAEISVNVLLLKSFSLCKCNVKLYNLL